MDGAWAVIVAAGRGERFGSAKQFAHLGRRLLYQWSLEAFVRHEEVEGVVLVVPAEAFGRLPPAKGKLREIVAGGVRRRDSVANGFRRIPPGESAVVLVHDGVRPLVSAELITRVIAAARESGAAVPALAVEDTVKEVSGGRVLRTLERAALRRIQTPQGFLHPILKQALEATPGLELDATDEAMLVERMGLPVAVVPGDQKNIKITTHLDLKLAEALIDE